MSEALSVIRARRDAIAAAIAELEEEDRDLGTAEQVLARLNGVAAPRDPARPKPPARAPHPAGAQPKSQRAIVLEVLRINDQAWMSSSEIVGAADRIWGAQVPEMSLRPLLTTMKRDRLIVRDGRRIALRERIEGARHARTPAHASN